MKINNILLFSTILIFILSISAVNAATVDNNLNYPNNSNSYNNPNSCDDLNVYDNSNYCDDLVTYSDNSYEDNFNLNSSSSNADLNYYNSNLNSSSSDSDLNSLNSNSNLNSSDYLSNMSNRTNLKISYDEEDIPSADLDMSFVNLGIAMTGTNTVYLNSSYTGYGYGTQQAPFNSIESAFNAVSSYGSKTILYIADGVYMVSERISISKSMSVVGQSLNVILKASNCELFETTKQNITVNFVNLTFTGGNDTFGGAIYNLKSVINVIGCVFKDNVAYSVNSSAYGGAIYNYEGVLRVYNSTFVNNSVNAKSDYGYGGAIANGLGNIYVYNSDFIENSVLAGYGVGGAIYNLGIGLTVFNSSFLNNTIKANYSLGGAICNWGSHANYFINSSFYGNKLYGLYTYGSAIANSGVLIELINSTVVNNSAYGFSVENGTVYNFNGIMYDIGNTIHDNYIAYYKNETLYAMDGQLIVSNAFSKEELADLPSSYDLRDYGLVTSVKNQGKTGACWSFASLASLESYLLKYMNVSYDFSENNMKNAMNSYGYNGTDYPEGGTYEMAVAYLLRWSGPVSENDDSFSAVNTSEKLGLDVLYHVQDVLFLPLNINFTDINQVKAAILKYGAVASSMYAISSVYQYNLAYFTNYSAYQNHGITIVGWDDSYSRYNFINATNLPEGDGAWIIKNSYGTKYGDGGYWYVSYYDKGFAGNGLTTMAGVAIVNAENSNNYADIYQYDPLGYVGESLGYDSDTAWFANQFEAISDNPLSAIGFYTFGDSEYLTQISVNDVIVYNQSGNVVGAGYHTVKLNDLVNLTRGDIFKIAVKLTTPDSKFPIAIETQIPYYSKATSSSNQSFISPDGISWYDISQDTDLIEFSYGVSNFTLSNTNVCLKAYTAFLESETNITNNTTSTNTSNTTSSKKISQLEFNKLDVTVGDNPITVLYNVTLKEYGGSPLSSKTVVASYDNMTYSAVTDSNGIAHLSIVITKNSLSSLSILFVGDENYNGASGSAWIDIIYDSSIDNTSSNITNSSTGGITNNTNDTNASNTTLNQLIFIHDDIIVNLESDPTYYLFNLTVTDSTGNPLSNKTIYLEYENTIYPLTTNSKGLAFSIIPIKSNGSDNLNLSFNGDNQYVSKYESVSILIKNNSSTNSSSSNSTINSTVNSTNNTNNTNNTNITNPSKIATQLLFNNMSTFVVLNNSRTGEWFNATLTDINNNRLANKTVYIAFNGKIYQKTTNSNGTVSLQINIGYQSANTFALTFLGDDTYSGTMGVAIIVVKPLNTSLTSTKKTYKSSAKTKTITATLKSNGFSLSNKQIIFSINNNFYITKTNSKGIASVKISLTSKKTYKYTVSFEGDYQYLAVTSSNKVIIK